MGSSVDGGQQHLYYRTNPSVAEASSLEVVDTKDCEQNERIVCSSAEIMEDKSGKWKTNKKKM